MKNEWWIVVDRYGAHAIYRDEQFAADRCLALENICPEHGPFRIVKVVPAEGVEALRALLSRCRPIVESEMALFDSMARHMAGGFDPAVVQSADDSANVHWELLKEIDAALEPKS